MAESQIPSWESAVASEETRQAWQRTSSANRRAAALSRGVEELGSQQEVARTLGVSAAAVSKALGQARQRSAGEVPPADFMELDLPRTAGHVLTLEQWRALPADRQAAAAEAAALRWGAIATATQRLAAQLKEAGAYLYERTPYDPENKTVEQEEAVQSDEADRAVKAGEKPAPALIGPDDLRVDPLPLATVYLDLGEAMRARTLEAIGSERFWSSLAHHAPASD
ncbi:hypothetical protein [Streptomyces sp. NPDC057939]|uniref:hypothetical protein n=1 Tax=Streptomyces sp. NPDC057939 TaxID=3346284 RepID=UPI0036E87C43